MATKTEHGAPQFPASSDRIAPSTRAEMDQVVQELRQQKDSWIKGKVALVLGAGNVSSIGLMDVLYKLFIENQATLLKMNPVNEYSGNGVVHNTLMFSRPQKSVLRGPFRSIPTPIWFVSKAKAGRKVLPRLIEFEAQPAFWKLPGILWPAVVE